MQASDPDGPVFSSSGCESYLLALEINGQVMREKKRLMMITQWFDPEPAFKGLGFAKELVARGFEVEVITGFPNYPGGKLYDGYRVTIVQKEVIDGVNVTRVPLYPSHDNNKLARIFNYVSFGSSALFYGLLFARKADVIYSYHPPLTVGVAASLIKFFRRIPMVLDIQDMWPDTLRATDMVNNKYILNIVDLVCRLVYRSADRIVVLSPGFKELLIERGVEKRKLMVIYNWADEANLSAHGTGSAIKFSQIKGFKVLFAGNVGQAQGLDVVLRAALSLQSDSSEVQFIILGRGLQLEMLKQKAAHLRLSNVHFVPAVSVTKVGEYLRSADAMLIHLNSDELFKITIPGKTQAYMAVGKPIIMGVNGDAADLVLHARCGLCFNPEDATELATAASQLASLDSDNIEQLGLNALNYYNNHLSISRGVDSFAELFGEVIEKRHL